MWCEVHQHKSYRQSKLELTGTLFVRSYTSVRSNRVKLIYINDLRIFTYELRYSGARVNYYGGAVDNDLSFTLLNRCFAVEEWFYFVARNEENKYATRRLETPPLYRRLTDSTFN